MGPSAARTGKVSRGAFDFVSQPFHKIAGCDGTAVISTAARSFRFRSTVLPRLPPRLRVLVGCAEVLQGGVDAADFVDIDLEAPRVTMVVCDDVEQPVPFIIERVRVDLGRLKVSADRREPQSTPVYFKSRYLPVDDETRRDQEQFETLLAATGLFEPGHPEPSWDKVQPALKSAMAKL